MAQSVMANPLSFDSGDAVRSEARATSWYARIIVLGAVSIIVGVLWDISWHRTIGRDSFWTPAHMAIYLGGLIGGFVGGWLIFRGTFLSNKDEQAAMVGVFGLRWLAIRLGFARLPEGCNWGALYGVSVPNRVWMCGVNLRQGAHRTAKNSTTRTVPWHTQVATRSQSPREIECRCRRANVSRDSPLNFLS